MIIIHPEKALGFSASKRMSIAGASLDIVTLSGGFDTSNPDFARDTSNSNSFLGCFTGHTRSHHSTIHGVFADKIASADDMYPAANAAAIFPDE